MPRPVTPAVAADIVIELSPRADSPILLIERKNPPFGWALPGGFVDVGETVEAAAVREAKEETGLVVTLVGLLGVYSEPARDPRGHTVTIVYIGTAYEQTPMAGDDAAVVKPYTLDALPVLAFDHARVLADYRQWKRVNASR